MDIFEKFSLGKIGLLRNLSYSGVVDNNKHVTDDIYFSWDNEQAEVAVGIRSAPNELMHIEAEIKGTPRWITLNLSLGSGVLVPSSTLCLVLSGSMDNSFPLKVFVRSKVDEELVDLYWDEAIELDKHVEVLLALCSVPETAATSRDAFHTLVLKLPDSSFKLSLYDMRVFAVLSDNTGLMPPMTLSSEAWVG